MLHLDKERLNWSFYRPCLAYRRYFLLSGICARLARKSSLGSRTSAKTMTRGSREGQERHKGKLQEAHDLFTMRHARALKAEEAHGWTHDRAFQSFVFS